MGPFSNAKGNKEFFIIAIDHFTKQVEAKALASITTQIVKDFTQNEVITRFRIPFILITNNEKQFEAQEFQEFCQELHVDHRFASVSYPQTNNLIEVTNRIIVQGLKKHLDSAKAKCIDELSNVLWSQHTTPHSKALESPFSLCFRTEALLPVEIRLSSSRLDNFSIE